MMRPATIFLGQRRRGDGLARAEEGSGEESARVSAFFFGEIHTASLSQIGLWITALLTSFIHKYKM